MSGTKSFPADNVKLHISSAADAPTGTMTVLMRTNRYYTDGSLLQTGEEYTVTKEWGQDALSRNWCEDVADVFPETETPSGLTAAETAATKALVSGDRITTWANRAALVTAGLTTAFFTDVGVGGSYWDYVGGRWRPSARRVMLANLTAEQTTNGTSLAVMYSVALLAGLWQDGDILEWRTSFTKSGGTAETATTDWRIGASAVSTGLTLGLSSSSLATTQTQQHSMHRLRRLSATTARNLSATGSNGLGTSTSALATRTIPDADAAVSYWQALGNLSVGAETLALTGAALYLESGA